MSAAAAVTHAAGEVDPAAAVDQPRGKTPEADDAAAAAARRSSDVALARAIAASFLGPRHTKPRLPSDAEAVRRRHFEIADLQLRTVVKHARPRDAENAVMCHVYFVEGGLISPSALATEAMARADSVPCLSCVR